MDAFILILFVLTYLGMAAGRVPGTRLDRSGIALIAAVLLAATGAMPGARIAGAVHFPTLLLLAGLMVLSARVRAAGLYDLAARWIALRAGRPRLLLALTVAVGGGLSAVLVNDIVVFAMAPILCRSLMAAGLDPRPYLFALAAASNAGSAGTLVGNPQNILIGQVGGLDFWGYAADAAGPTLAALVLVYGCIAVVWRRELAAAPVPVDLPEAGVARRGVVVCTGALVLLLVLFATPLPREVSALLVAGFLMLGRTVPSRQLLDEIDAPLLILFASLFVVTAALGATGLPQAVVADLAERGIVPGSAAVLVPFSLAGSNTIGNVPAVMLLLQVWPGLGSEAMTSLALYSTLAGNLFLVGSLANLIVAERAAGAGVRLGFADHARAGVPITLLSLAVAAAWRTAAG